MSDQECLEANHRLEEKIDLILKKLNEIEANRSKFFEEMSASIKATTTVLTAASHPPLQAPPSSTPTTSLMKCSNDDRPWATSSSGHIDKETTPTVALDLGDGEDKVHDPCIVTKDSSKVTPTMYSMKCSSPDTKPDLTMVAEVTYASVATTSMELVTAQEAIGAMYSDTSDHSKVMHTKCLTVVLDAIGDTDQAMVVFQTWTDAFKDDPTSVQFMDFFSSTMMANIKWNTPMPTKCSVQCLGHGSMALMPTNPFDVNPWPPPTLEKYRSQAVVHMLLFETLFNEELRLERIELKPWPPPTYDGVISGWDSQPMAGPKFKLYWARVRRLPPWPPHIEVSCLALVCHDNVMIFTELKDINLHLGELKPWPPPSQTNFKNIMVQPEQCKYWEIRVEMSIFARKEKWNLLNQKSCTMVAISSLKEHVNGQEQIWCRPWNPSDYKVSPDIIMLITSSVLHPYHLDHIVSLTYPEGLDTLVSHKVVQFGRADTACSHQNRHTIVRTTGTFVRPELGTGNGTHILLVSEDMCP
ncbi:hypothetical protein OsI_06669 [Oryza sativa Indica Group]|uniref:Uncharacterized protein n=1 Tax=Oryza sativa subsp. indica TaxID=39946 RepID=A2X388_ORYSI|nr:hypothetical protein OsI_06669 [Oryza sativa Indica Group]